MTKYNIIRKGGPEVLAKILAEQMLDFVKEPDYRGLFLGKTRGEILGKLERDFYRFLMSEEYVEIRENNQTKKQIKFNLLVEPGPKYLAIIMAEEALSFIGNPSFRGDFRYSTREATLESLRQYYHASLMFDVGAERQQRQKEAEDRRMREEKAEEQRQREAKERRMREEEAEEQRQREAEERRMRDFYEVQELYRKYLNCEWFEGVGTLFPMKPIHTPSKLYDPDDDE